MSPLFLFHVLYMMFVHTLLVDNMAYFVLIVQLRNLIAEGNLPSIIYETGFSVFSKYFYTVTMCMLLFLPFSVCMSLLQ